MNSKLLLIMIQHILTLEVANSLTEDKAVTQIKDVMKDYNMVMDAREMAKSERSRRDG